MDSEKAVVRQQQRRSQTLSTDTVASCGSILLFSSIFRMIQMLSSVATHTGELGRQIVQHQAFFGRVHRDSLSNVEKIPRKKNKKVEELGSTFLGAQQTRKCIRPRAEQNPTQQSSSQFTVYTSGRVSVDESGNKGETHGISFNSRAF